MRKELIIIVYKINIDGLSVMGVDELMHRYAESCSFKNDEELKENYTIREIYIPICHDSSDVKVIYPVTSSLLSDFSCLIDEINEKLNSENISDDIKKKWNQLLREFKIRNLYDKK